MANELIITREELDPKVVYSGGLNAVLKKIKDAVSVCPTTVDTAANRDEIRSTAHKIARSKTLLDTIGKDLGEDFRKKLEKINADRKKAVEYLTDLQDRVRKPLTEWEEAEEKRTASFKETIQETRFAGETAQANWMNMPVDAMADRLREIEALRSMDWQEFREIAEPVIDRAIEQTKEAIAKKTQHDAEQAELAALRAEKEARAAEEKAKAEEEAKRLRDDQIRAEAAEKARLEAQAAADAEKRRIEQQAIEAERKRVADEQAAKEAEEAARASDKAHRAAVHRATLQCLTGVCGLTDEQGKAVIQAIVKGQIANVQINY